MSKKRAGILRTDFDSGISVNSVKNPLGLEYGRGVYGPTVEKRTLDSIRNSLKNPNCNGPDIVYSIAMDVGKNEHKEMLEDMMLLFGVVTYAQGRLGDEPIRSQGHIHSVSTHSGWSPPEIYEIWEGEAVIYMQETAKDNPGKCYAIYAVPGDVIIVPPKWAHATISANINNPLTFGAWCDREYGFEYADVRAHSGLAWYPILTEEGKLEWVHNENYEFSELIEKKPNEYHQYGIEKNVPIYTQFEREPNKFQFVSKPYLKEKEWEIFEP